MPNWCQNTLIIKGPTEDVTRLLEAVEGSDTKLSLRKIITTPEELQSKSSPNRDEDDVKRLTELYGAKDWYDWQVANWGTKWDIEATIYDDSMSRSPGYSTYTDPEERVVQMSFDSAWSPPIPAIAMLAKQFPNTNIYHSYDESGCDFAGYNMYSKGRCIKEVEWPSYSHIRTYIEPDADIFDYFPED